MLSSPTHRGKNNGCPPFGGGENVWRVRYAPYSTGRYSYKTPCSDTKNQDLHGRSGVLQVTAYAGGNALLRHGPIRVASDHLHLEHEDGTPFFWLGALLMNGAI